MNKTLNYKRLIATCLLVVNPCIMPNIGFAESLQDLEDLPSLDFDALMATDIQVTAAMKRLQSVSETAASIYVLTNKEITESGVTSVAQALALVPGMQVRKIDTNQWAITTRSIAGRYSSNLLVMVDGQSIYNPGFSGVYWEALNIPLNDIERIEIIRGQGGLLWGSNATNGVVNIISKNTGDTRNVLVQAAAGSELDHKVDFRVGGDLGQYSAFRVFGSLEESDKSSKSNRLIEVNDSGKKQSIGGRVDLNLNNNLSLLAQAQYTHTTMGQNLRLANIDTYEKGYYQDTYTRYHFQFMTRLEHRISSTSNQMLQASLTSQQGNQLFYKDDFLTTDIDYQMNTLINDIQFDWGVNYRHNNISVAETDYFTNIKALDSYRHVGGFLQAQFNLLPNRLKLIVGNRSEKNSFTGWEHQPMARLLWTPYLNHTVWASVSQGVKIPSLLEYNNKALISSANRIKSELVGSDNIDAEKSVSKELGYRYKANSWGLDVSIFHTKARDVLIVEPNINDTFTYISINFVPDGKLTTYGGEAVIKWQPYDKLSTELGYSFTSYKYDLPVGTEAAIGEDTYLRQIIAKAHFSLTEQHSFSVIYRIEDGAAYRTDDFSVLDLSWNWQVTPLVRFSLVGNNLLYGKHLEYNNTKETYSIGTFVEPSYLARITAKF